MAYQYGDKSLSDDLIKRMIPILVLWSKFSWTKFHTYSDLQRAIGANTPRLGWHLGRIDDIFKMLSVKHKRYIPTLNTLIASSTTGIPSDGLGKVDKGYEGLSKAGKKAYAIGKNAEAHDYDYNWVLNELGLEIPTLMEETFINEARTSKSCSAAEGERHRRLKEYIAQHPEAINVKVYSKAENEHKLLSGDQLDVFIITPDEIWAVEVKSIISDNCDILRGIFQCVKYRAVLEAERMIKKTGKAVKTLLVIEGKMPAELKMIAGHLDISIIEEFVID